MPLFPLFRLHRLQAFVLSLGAFLLPAGMMEAASQLSVHNAIISNTFDSSGEVDGRLVVNNIQRSGTLTFAQNVASSASQINVHVQGNVVNGGTIQLPSGSFYIPNIAQLNGRNVSFGNGGSIVTTPAFDFNAVFGGVAAESSIYASLPPNSTVTIPPTAGAVELVVGASVGTGVAVFSVNGSSLLNNANVQTLDLNLNGQNPSAIIINLTGTSITYSSSGSMIGNLAGATWRNKILWNASAATSITASKTVYGSVLAPLASYDQSGGTVEGSIAVKDLLGQAKVHFPLWVGVDLSGNDFGDNAQFAVASAAVLPTLRMGAATDGEGSPAADAGATADDTSGSDDEDGVVLPASVLAGASSSFTVTVSNTSGSTAYLNAWIDFNRNGLLTDSGERVASNQVVSNGSSNSTRSISFTVPVGTAPGSLGLRLRLSSSATSSATGHVANGEVEDHLLTISESLADVVLLLDQGSSIDSTEYAAMTTAVHGIIDRVLAANPSHRIAVVNYAGTSAGPPQAQIWIESDFTSNSTTAKAFAWRSGQPGTLQNGDDAHGAVGLLGRALDGISDASILSPQKTLTHAANRPLVVLLFTDAERNNGTSFLVNTASSGTGTAAAFQNYTSFKAGRGARFVGVAVSPSATAEAAMAAITSAGGAFSGVVETNPSDPDGSATTPRRLTSSTGFALNAAELDAVAGNVDQAAMNVTPVADYSDYSGLPIAGSIANPNLRLGSSVDAEFGATLNSTATGDDVTGTDDEDALAVPASVTPGSTAFVTMNLTNISGATSFLNVWVDFNGNGLLTDPGELQTSNSVIANGSNNQFRIYRFTIPPGTTPGNKAVRVRLTSVSNPGTDGIDGYGEVEDRLIAVVAPNMDFGDHAAFPSASSQFSDLLRIGASVDAEASQTVNTTATGDDATGSDDEDGVTVPATMTLGQNATISVNVHNLSGVQGYLNGWVDFNNNGSLTDSGEQILSNQAVDTGTADETRTISFTVPITAAVGASSARFRLTSVSSPGPDGADGLGEVEDIAVTFVAPPSRDYGDLLTFPSASSLSTTKLLMGAKVDSELVAAANAGATGDDTSGEDDEDGVTPPPSAPRSAPSTFTVVVSNTNGSTAYLNVWADFNNNGLLTDSGEQIVSNHVVANGVNSATRTFTITPPVNAVMGSVGLRARLTTLASPGPDGEDGSGEVEDHLLNVTAAPSVDYGDYAGFSSASQVPSADIRIGTNTTDGETAYPSTGLASVDDTTSADDEDLTMPVFTVNRATTLSIPVTVVPANLSGSTARLRVFVDWNGDGSFSGTDETQNAQTVSASGTQTFLLTPPVGTVAGTKFLRIRITEGSSAPSSTGFSWLKGEVEDYPITVLPEPTIDFGDYASFPSAGSTVVPTLAIGTLTDAEQSAVTNSTATGDDADDSDDEDGLFLPTGVAKGENGFISVQVSNTSGNSAYLNVWVDFNNNGVLTDAGEQVASNQIIATGTLNASRTINFSVPVSAVVGNVGVRARLSSIASPGPDGNDGNGEVEDALLAILPEIVTDFGDSPRFPSASQTFSADIRMGTNPTDKEAASPSTGDATMDDLSGSDDEDLVIPPFFAGSETVFDIPITLNTAALSSNRATLRLFVDWNNDGDVDDAGETSAPVTSAVNGTSLINIALTPPSTATFGPRHMRLRIVEGATAPTFGGSSTLKGEVEDYVVTLCQDGYAYGVGAGNLYQVKMSDGSAQFITTLVSGFGGGNGTAYVESVGTAGVVIYCSGSTNDGRLGVWDRATGVSNYAGDLDNFGVPANTTIHSGAFFNGYYWFITDATDDLWKVSVSGSSGAYFITSASKVSDLWGNSRAHTYGDMVIKADGTMLAIATRVGGGVDYFTANLLDAVPTASHLFSPPVMQNGIALRADGKLYGGLGVSNLNKDWYEMNPDTGEVASVLGIGAISGMSDLGLAACTPAPVLSRTDYGDYPGFAEAGQTADSAIYMGGNPTDGDPASPGGGLATEDDLSNVDDEDLVLPDFVTGMSNTFQIPVTMTGGVTSGLIGIWVDWNGDGDVADTGETLPPIPVGAAGTITATVTVPAGTTEGTKFMRVSITEGTTAPAFSGVSNLKGEVEDYAITVINALDSGDFSPFPSAQSIVSPALKIGSLTDVDAVPVLNITATGDDTTGSDDEDGLAIPAVMAHSGPGAITVNVTNTTGVTAFLNVWVDFNGNGVLTDAGEQVASNLTISNGTNGANRNINFTVPANAVAGVVGVRARLTSVSSPGPDGLDGNGEIEDGITSLQTLLDFGDHLPFVVAAQYASTDIRLGAVATDAERSSPTAGMADADDSDGGDDEETLLPTLMVGYAGSLSIPVTITPGSLTGGTASLRIFADWNGDGDVADSGETQTARTVSGTGVQVLSLTPPVGTIPGTKFLRIRLSDSSAVPAFSGVSTLRGEVEDVAMVVVNPMSIGNLVFDDRNYNDVADPYEGVSGVTVRLYQEGDVPGVSVPVAEQVTGTGGLYRFQGLFEGRYFVHVPASQFGPSGLLRGFFSITGTATTDDHLGEDGIDTETPHVNGVSSGIIDLVAGTQPTAATGETGINASDDDVLDSDGNLTIDFGFYRRVGIGNLIFYDADNDGLASSGEGVDGVEVEVYDLLATPGVDAPIFVTTTGNGGRYLFSSLVPGAYIIHVPARMFQSGAPLYGLVSIAEGLFGDDDVGEDGLNHTEPSVDGVSSNIVFIEAGAAPTSANGETGVDSASDDLVDASMDLTIDFGFQVPMGIGNLVFHDANANGRYDSGEGVEQVTVELYRSTDVPGYVLPESTVMTDAAGHYRFDRVPSGTYFAHIPGQNFQFGGPLAGLVSVSGVEAMPNGDDSIAENGIDSPSPNYTGISSAVFTIASNSQPTDAAPGATSGENGFRFNEDTPNDDQYNLTIDFGFVPPDENAVGVGNLVFDDRNGNGVYDSDEGVAGVTVQVFRVDGFGAPLGTALATTTTTTEGCYYFGGLTAGDYRVFLPASNFATGAPLAGRVVLPGVGTDNGQDDHMDENGEDASSPGTTGVWSSVFDLAPGLEPVDEGTELGKNSYMDATVDANVDLTIDFGFYMPVGVGNLVFIDANNNGFADAGEGVGGVQVRLFAAGADPLNAAPVATLTTSTDTQTKGRFLFTGLRPGVYFLHLPPSQFALGATLYDRSVIPLSTADGDDNAGQNGLAGGDPKFYGVSTSTFSIEPGLAPAASAEAGLFSTEDDNVNGFADVNVDLTQDIGFASGVCVGNLVFDDTNGNGKYDPATETGINGVYVELYRVPLLLGSPELVATTVTNSSGLYAFCVPEGTYYVHIPARMFQVGGALYLGSSSPGPGLLTGAQDDDQSEDGIDDADPATNGISSGNISLTAGQQPTAASGETGFGSEADDGDDADSNLTIDFGFVFNTVQPSAEASLMTFDAEEEAGSGTFAQWQRENDLGGQNGPTDDADGDGLSNLLEHALGTDATNGLSAGPRFRLEKNASSGVDALLIRPATLPADVRYRIEGATSAGAWQPIEISPAITYPGDDTQRARYAGVDAQPLFQAQAQGRVRLVVELDANLDGTPEATADSSVFAFAKRTLQPGQSTLGQPLLSPALFTGTVSTVNGTSLTIQGAGQAFSIAGALERGREYFVQVLDGSLTGHRFEVDEASTTAAQVVVIPDDARNSVAGLPAGLAGALITLRPHWRVQDLAAAASFTAGASSATADRLLFLENNAYTTLWARTGTGGVQWVSDADGGATDRSSRVIAFGEGFMVHPRSTAVTLTLVGEVSPVRQIVRLRTGAQMLGSLSLEEQSPQTLGMTSANGFLPGLAATGDRLRVWQGDNSPGASAYDPYYLAVSGQWVAETDAGLSSQNATLIFKPWRAVVVITSGGPTVTLE